MDDEPYIRNILTTILKTLGYTTVAVKDGSEALKEFKKAQDDRTPFAAVVLDLTIPGGMGGRDTAAEIRKMNTVVPIIAASGYSDDPVMASPRTYGFNEKIDKPFRMQEFGDILNKALKERGGQPTVG
jgi:CheY-like chemotaxis protein